MLWISLHEDWKLIWIWLVLLWYSWYWLEDTGGYLSLGCLRWWVPETQSAIRSTKTRWPLDASHSMVHYIRVIGGLHRIQGSRDGRYCAVVVIRCIVYVQCLTELRYSYWLLVILIEKGEGYCWCMGYWRLEWASDGGEANLWPRLDYKCNTCFPFAGQMEISTSGTNLEILIYMQAKMV